MVAGSVRTNTAVYSTVPFGLMPLPFTKMQAEPLDRLQRKNGSMCCWMGPFCLWKTQFVLVSVVCTIWSLQAGSDRECVGPKIADSALNNTCHGTPGRKSFQKNMNFIEFVYRYKLPHFTHIE
jgi:hypothetical protein